MNSALSHDRVDETIERKTIWFRSLSLDERMEMLCSFTDLALTVNSKRAAAKDIDMEDVRLLELAGGNDA